MGYTLKGVGLDDEGLSDDSLSPLIYYSYDDLSSMTVKQIKSLASELGYSITSTLKNDIIQEFLTQQSM